MTTVANPKEIVHQRELGDKYSDMIRREIDKNGREWVCSGTFRMTVLKDDEDEDEIWK